MGGNGNLYRHPISDLNERSRRGGLGLGDNDRNPTIATQADRLIHRQAAQERHIQRSRNLLPAAKAEDVAFMVAVRTRVLAHVLDKSECRAVEFLVHPHGAPTVGE